MAARLRSKATKARRRRRASTALEHWSGLRAACFAHFVEAARERPRAAGRSFFFLCGGVVGAKDEKRPPQSMSDASTSTIDRNQDLASIPISSHHTATPPTPRRIANNSIRASAGGAATSIVVPFRPADRTTHAYTLIHMQQTDRPDRDGRARRAAGATGDDAGGGRGGGGAAAVAGAGGHGGCVPCAVPAYRACVCVCV